MENFTRETVVDPNHELRERLIGVLTQKKYLDFYDLPKKRVVQWLKTMVFNGKEVRFSPGYESAGYGHNQTKEHEMAESSVGTADSTYEHEARHGLHNLKCQTMYEGKDAKAFLAKFSEAVLGDKKFVDQIDKPGGSPLQEKMLKKVRELCSKKNASLKEIKDNAWMLGALTYQHAYFVDPGMCEAVASFGDNGLTFVIDQYNQWFAKLLIPGRQFFEGYANPNWQNKFKNADDAHKAFLVKSEDYDFKTFWLQ
jgi:hypothetical protein